MRQAQKESAPAATGGASHIANQTVNYISDAGLALVNLKRHSKRPVAHDWQRAAQGITDASQVNGGNIGLHHLDSRTCCIDVDDVQEAAAWFEDQGIDLTGLFLAEDAVQIRSGRDNRGKLLYRLPDGVDWLPYIKTANDKLELRCANSAEASQQDVLPPSIHPDTGEPYQWIGDWRSLPTLPDAILRVWLATAENDESGSNTAPDRRQIVDGAESASNAALVSAIVTGDSLHDSTTKLAFRHVEDGMQPAKVVETVRGLMDAMPDKGDLKRWRDRYADIPRLVTDARRKLASAEFPSLPPDIETKRFELLTVSELMALPDMTWRVDGVIPDNSVGLIIGQYQAGKSFVVIDLLARLACGADWFGHEINPGRVVYCALEGNAGIKKRVQAWQKQHADDIPSTFDTAFRTLLTPFQIIQPADIQGLADAIDEAGGADVIAVDTLAQAAPGIDENSAQDMGRVVHGLQSLQRKTGGIVIGVHHLGKDTTRGARGNSNLPAAMDFALAITGDRHISTDFDQGGKTKDGEPINHYFDLDQVALSNGDTSAVVVEAAQVRHEVTRLSPTEKIAIRSYNAACKKSGQWGDDDEFIGVHLDDWRTVFYEMSTADSTDSKRKAFSRVRSQLQDKGVLKVDHDMYTMEDEDTFRMMTINNERDAA